jgi:HPt (histidine-containing phosphotransfer) domain-containing protein
MGNVSFALVLLDELETNGKQQVDAIVLHAASEETHAAAEAAHSLKGAAAIIGAEPLRRKADEIEVAGHTGETSLLLDMVHDLRVQMDRCLTYIPNLRTDLQRRSSSAR